MSDPLALIRPYVQAITHSLPKVISGPVSELITAECYGRLVEDFDPLGSPLCVQLAVSKAVGVGIIAASTVVKVPQMLKLVAAGSAEGVSFLSYLMETTAYLITLAYSFRSGFPFSTYGETVCIVVQNIIISVLVLHFAAASSSSSSRSSSSSSSAAAPLWPAAVFVAAVAAAAYALFTEAVVSTSLLRNFQLFVTIPLGLLSKIPQIIAVHKQKSTGQLSAFAVFNYLAGSLARVGTTLAEVNDPLILASFLGGTVLNLVLAGQMVAFWNNNDKSKNNNNNNNNTSAAGGKASKGKKRA